MSGLLLVDATAMAYRAHFAAGPYDMGAPFRFVPRWLRQLRSELPSYTPVATWDRGGETFRHRLFPQYKQHRKSKDQGFVESLVAVRAEVARDGWRNVWSPGFEADDALATLSANADGAVVIVSPDKDILQLVDGRVEVWRPRPKGERMRMRPLDVMMALGVPPEHVAELLAVVGDASDGIPGVPMIGAGWASGAISDHGGLAAIFAGAGSGKKFDRVRQFRERIELWCQLTRLRIDATIEDAA